MTHINHTWLPQLAELMDAHTPCVLITVTEARGSTPREAGTKMLVTADAQFGTIGGGNLEFEAIEEARQLLESASAAPSKKNYALGPTLAQCCGGSVSVLLEPFLPSPKRVILFGAGHVGRELVQVLHGLPIRIIWVDSRAQEFPDSLPPSCRKQVLPNPVEALGDISEADYIIVMTHSHELDFELVKTALSRGTFAYLGLIGSDTKRVRFEKRLVEQGIAKDALGRLTCPIGVEGVIGKHPREIAIAVSAQILALGLTHPQRAGTAF